MRTLKIIFLAAVFILTSSPSKSVNPASVYNLKPEDPEALYFTTENFNIKTDGKTDISDELQSAINRVKQEKNFGILFIPEGTYLISKTIYVPPAVRLIGYGKKRPLIVLKKNSPGYQQTTPDSKEKYMIWFTGSVVTPDRPPRDAGAGTFYSAVSNIDLRIEEGNPFAVALRTHYAQHGFVSHCIINTGKGKAGISEVGNEMENVQFIGGDYGIITGPTSPSWPMMMTDTYFEGQRKAAIRCHNSGLAIVRMQVRNVPVAVEIEENDIDRLYLEDCLFENVSSAGIILNAVPSALTQVNVIRSDCNNVPVWARFRDNGNVIPGKGKYYRVKEFVYGLTMTELGSNSAFETIIEMESLENKPILPVSDISKLPPMETWVNIRTLGARGDGESDDTGIFREAITKHKVIYIPQGWYRLTGTIKMSPGTILIGLHPWATQFVLKESEPAFSGFGGPIPVVESSVGGSDIVNGIGISTGGYNYRAVGCKWMAGEKSLMNDVKFAGGHGTMRRPVPGEPVERPYVRQPTAISSPLNPVNQQGLDLAWDNQHWSLWITNNGGGVFKDIWTASTYAASGLLISNTSTPGRIYAMSLEHHVRNEARLDNIHNWKIYAFQLEEESREGKECQMVDMTNCSSISFANLWLYRVIRVTTPKRFGVRIWNCSGIEFRNLHNYTQKLWVTEFPVWDVNKEISCYPWEFAKLTVTGQEAGQPDSELPLGVPVRLVSGFDFAQGITADSKGNIYFCETRKKRIYRWSPQTGATLLADFPFEPFVLANDSKDNLLVVCRYDPQPGYKINGIQETVKKLPDDNPAYSSFGNSGWAAYGYSINPNDPDDTFKPMPRVATAEIGSFEKTYYPSSRWHYTFDQAAVYYPDSAFMAPDGSTYIQETYDIGRCAALSAAIPGQMIYASDEIGKRTVQMRTGEKGKLSELKEILPRGETSNVTDNDGNLYVADGQIFVYDKNLSEQKRYNLPERPISMVFGGTNENTLFVTTLTSLWAVRVK